MHNKHNNRHYHHHYGGDLGTGGGAFNKVFDMRVPKAGTPFFKNCEIRFGGNLQAFLAEFSKLTPDELQSAKMLHLSIFGNMTKQGKQACQRATVILSLLACFIPLLLFQCDCFNKQVQPMFEWPVEYYESIAQVLLKLPNLERLVIYAQDNKLNATRTILLEQAVTQLPRLNYFWLSNCVHSFDLEEREYSSFDSLFPRCRANKRLLFNLHWDGKHFKSEQPAPANETTQQNINGC